MKLDVFTHVFPRRFFDRMLEVAGELGDMGKRVRGLTTLYDLDRRFRVMDEFGDDFATGNQVHHAESALRRT